MQNFTSCPQNTAASKNSSCILPTFDTFIFDLDGTLLNTLPDLVVLTNQALARNGFPPRTTAEILSYVGNGIKALIDQAAPEGTSHEQREQVLRDWKTLFPAYPNDLTQPYPKIPKVLAKLKSRGFKLGLLSNKFDQGVQQIIPQYLPDIFSIMHGESAEFPRKPNPTGLIRSIEELESTASRTIYIGDSPGDITTARAAHVFALGVTWGYHSAHDLQAACADAVISSPEELLRFAAPL